MLDFNEINNKIAPPSNEAMDMAKNRWNSIAKPIGSLGLLEDAIILIAGLTGSHDINLNKKAVFVFCADNGVVEEGVTQTDSSVTLEVASNITKNKASVCVMASVANADVVAVDVGMNKKATGVLDRSIAFGTKNFTKGPAMSRSEAEKAILVGIELVKEYKEKGYSLIATGEMGIGNTTTASAMASVLLSLPIESVTGRGAGINDEGLRRKYDAIYRAIQTNSPDKDDALDVLIKLGGFDIAAMAGAFIGGAIYRVPILIDGVISAVAALCAKAICPACDIAMLASHLSCEVPASLILEKLNKKPIIYASMRLGEGTGAVCAMPLLDMAASVYNNMITFEDASITPYEVMKK